MQKALITGASSGIGKELAYVMASKGHDLVLVARNLKELNAISTDIQATTSSHVDVIALDLSVAGSAKKLYDQTKKEKIQILVNNAGVGLRGDFFNDDAARTTAMAQLNMISLMELSQLYGKDFVKRGTGRILNVASITAFFPGPKQPVYYATKAFVRSLSRALAFNLRGTGVTVTALHPGVTKTQFFASSNAAGFTAGASASSVARLGYKAMMAGKIEVTHGLRNKLLTSVFARIIPYRFQAAIVDSASEV